MLGTIDPRRHSFLNLNDRGYDCKYLMYNTNKHDSILTFPSFILSRVRGHVEFPIREHLGSTLRIDIHPPPSLTLRSGG